MATRYEKFKELLKFRRAMGLSLSKEKIKYIWGRRFLRELEELNIDEGKGFLSEIKDREDLDEMSFEKLKIAKEGLPKLKVFNWVRFVGVSGSVAAGFAKESDDIDIFVVVRDGTMWFYRAIIAFRNIFHNKIRAKRHKDLRNKLCVNLICEERGLEFPNDIFNMHELLFLIPIYNKRYKRYVLSMNQWLEGDFYVKKELLRSRVLPKKRVFFLLRLINFLAFIAQLIFMFLSGHNPEKKRLIGNYKKGRIEFFEYEFRVEKLERYLEE
ncbi:MAG: hypothetical protein WCY37_00070 [Candidatus Dojkabacteria bacterium]